MSEDLNTVEADVPGDWLMLAGALGGLLDHDPLLSWNGGPDTAWKGAPGADGFKMTVFDATRVAHVVADVWLSGDPTVLYIRAKDYRGAVEYWKNMIKLLGSIALETQSIRRMVEPHADEVIERFYRTRAAGKRITLKQLAEQTGYSYSWLRQAKVVYDRRGGFGSKAAQNKNKNSLSK